MVILLDNIFIRVEIEDGGRKAKVESYLKGGSSSSRFLIWDPPNKETKKGGDA